MKLFAKKTLAMLLALSMVMSVCVFAGDDKTLELNQTATLTATAPEGKTVIWESSDDTKVTVNNGTIKGIALGDATITAKYCSVEAAEGVEAQYATIDTWAVTVTKPAIKSVEPVTVKVPKGLVGNKLASYFPTSFQVTLGSGSTKTLNVGADKDLTLTVGGADTETAGTYPCSASLTAAAAEVYDLAEGVNFNFNIQVVTAWELSQITMSDIIDGDEDTVGGMDDKIEYAIESVLGKDVTGSSISFDFSSGYYGSVSDSTGTYTVNFDSDGDDEEKLYEDGYLVDIIDYKATCGGVEYTGSVKLTMYTTDVGANFTYAGGTLSGIASRIDSMMGGHLEAIEFDSIELDGGMLWEDDNYDEEVYEEEYYTSSELAAMVYMPDGSGETSYLSYVAYTDYDADDGEVEEYSDYIEGTIYLSADEFLLLTAEIGNDEVLDIDGEELLEAVYDWDDDFEVKYIKFSSIPNSTSSGYLYYEYDEDDNSNTKVTSSKSYYVDPTGSQTELTGFTYVPADSTEGVINIVFKAHKSASSSVTGIIQINVIEVADITIGANKGQTVEIDPDLFLEFIEEKDTSNKDLEIVSVAISGAPYQPKKGYLVTDGEELNKSGTKTFYADEEDVDVDKKKYDLFDLYFKGGSSDNTVNGTFKVTYLRSGSTTKRYAEGTIDFVTGAATVNSLSGTTPAAMVVNFSKSLGAFEALGDNDNEYIVFTTLPVGGKLVYNWGQAGQKDVTVGTEYWLNYKAGKQLMANVTFVPSYSASKIDQTVSMNVKGYNSKGKSVVGQVNIAVDYALVSAQFSDVANSTYADSVDFLFNEGITTGMTATTFGPNSNVTRAQFVTFLWRAAGSPAVYGTNQFTDVKSTGEFAYAYQAILWAVQNGITTGRSATKFDPAANVTHQELLTFLYRYDVKYLKHSDTKSTYVNYTDYASVDTYAQDPVKWADYKGILSGYTIQPKVAGNRATVALWLHRMLTL